MKTVLETLEKISTTSSRLAKEDLLRECSNPALMQAFLDAALNPYRQFWFAKTPKKPRFPDVHIDYQEEGLKFFKLLKDLSDRKIVGNAARDSVNEFFTELDDLAYKWFSRCLLKNLRAGVASTTVNKIWPNCVPVFDCMLADAVKLDKLQYPVLVEPKFDGYRGIAIITGRDPEHVTLHSRNGKVFDTFPHIQEEIAKLDYLQKEPQLVLDGEIIGESFSSMQKQAFRKDKGDTSDKRYAIFDIMTLQEWENRETQSLVTRKELLKTVLPASDNVLFAPNTYIVDSEENLLQLYSDLLNQGYEGVMLKDLNASYDWSRGKGMKKLKPTKSMDCKVLGFEVGSPNTKFENTLGKLRIQMTNGTECLVGSGFSEEERDSIWNNKDSFLGKIIEVEYQEIAADGRLRFPAKKRWRDDK